MRQILLVVLVSLFSLRTHAEVLFSYPPSPSGGLIASSWVNPEGSDSDMYAYNDFALPSTELITEVNWRGGYIYNAVYGRANDFTITFFESIVGGSQPHVTNPQLPEIYLARYHVGGNAGETLAGIYGGTVMYDYRFVLPTPFQATAGTKYWLRIEAFQSVYPDWGISVGTGGDGLHFRFSTGLAMFQFVPNDTSFTLLNTVTGGVGAVANGGDVPGPPLTIQKAPGSAIALSWGPSCLLTDTDFEIYQGQLGSFASHMPIVCSTSGANSTTVTPGTGSRYYIVVARNGSAEGSHGKDSNGAERSAGPAACRPRSIWTCS